jgi:hypothetical protein
MESKTNMAYTNNNYSTEINLKEIFSDEDYKIILKYLNDEEVKDKLTQKRSSHEPKRTTSFKASILFDKTDFIFKLLRITGQKLRLNKEVALSHGLEW